MEDEKDLVMPIEPRRQTRQGERVGLLTKGEKTGLSERKVKMKMTRLKISTYPGCWSSR
jgi:hypothetical protein